MTCALKNRGPFKPEMVIQDGWIYGGDVRMAKTKTIPFRMAEPCQFQKDDKYQLPDCIGCSHKETL